MSMLDKLLGKPDTEEKLRRAARYLTEAMSEAGLVHKQADEEEPVEEQVEVTEDTLASIIADAMATAMDVEELPDDFETVVNAVAMAVHEAIGMMRVEQAAEPPNIEDMPEAERAFQHKEVTEMRKLLGDLSELQDTLITEQVELGDEITALNTSQDTISESVVTVAEGVKAMAEQVGATLEGLKTIKRQLALRPRQAIEAPETVVGADELTPENLKSIEDDEYELDPVMGVRVRRDSE